MYKTVLFGLLFLAASSLVLSLTGNLFIKPVPILISLVVVTSTCYLTNIFFAKLFKATTNSESAIITSLILFFLFIPPSTKQELFTLVIAATLASASKYLINFHKTHIFNPAAIGAVITPLLGFDGAIWWVATPNLLPFTLLVSFLIIRKLRRQKLVAVYFASFISMLLFTGQLTTVNGLELGTEILTSWPVIFFAGVMLTEPLTMPNRNYFQLLFGLLVGALAALKFHIGPLYSSPELVLVTGNLFAFLVTKRDRYNLILKSKKQITPQTHELSFASDKPITFSPGQYLEWTFPHQKTDIRGNRRYFTIASSPTEKEVMLTIKTFVDSSSYKKSLIDLNPGDSITASHVSGDFLLPENPKENLVFIAGGIGITPFRSMIKYLLDKKQTRNINLLYASANKEDFVYQELYKQAESFMGLKTQYFATKTGQKIDPEVIKSLPNYKTSTYLISGPDAMVKHYKKILNNLGIHKIITDYFPGF